MRFTAALFLVLFLIPSLTYADQLRDGHVAYNRHDYQTALKLWLPLANHGKAAAQYMVGLMCHDGQGVARDYESAMTWFRKAADKGNIKSQIKIGWMYEQGEGVQQDYAEAAQWYRKAADQGDGVAQWRLGELYEQGQGVKQDHVQAYLWLSLAATNNPMVSIDELNSISAKMTPEQIGEAKRLGNQWRPVRARNPALASQQRSQGPNQPPATSAK
jgi:hypothetical protein